MSGVLHGAGAGALWGLVFLVPALVSDFRPLDLTIGRYLAYGIISAALIAPRLGRLLPRIGRAEWLGLLWISFMGNIVYYLLLSAAVQMGGIAMTSLVVGFLPVAVTIIGSRDKGAVPLRKLAPSLMLCALGAVCIGWQAMGAPASGSQTKQLIGLACAIGALAAWTIFAVGNSRWLARLDGVSAQDWNLLTGVVTGALAIMLIPAAVVLPSNPHGGEDWLRLVGTSIGLAVFASIIGNALWNRMSQLLPLTLVGQMILFETLFALIYGFVWQRRLPAPLEVVAFAIVVLSVVTCIAAHRKPAGGDQSPA
ncbi:DMT family transporter [Caulobacter sp. 73W]|uniref:DMT family transporter n=1 Tax=Caulobacter sp. 73W TaxID=3161137 RepID=A0AB39KUR7_9CAUL